MMMVLALLLVFLVFAVLMLRGRLPAMLALPAMALLMAVLSGASLEIILNAVIGEGCVQLAPAYVAVFFGAMLGRVTLLTGIAERIVKTAAEFSSDRPLWIALTLCTVTAGLFVSLTGLGAIIMTGTLVLPILISVGIPRQMAACMFLMAYGIGYILNPTLWEFYSNVLKVDIGEISPFALRLMLINTAVFGVFVLYYSRRYLRYATFSAATAGEQEPLPKLPVPAYFTPLVPLALHLAFHWPVIPSFLAGSVYGVLCSRWRESGRLLARAAIKGLEDAAPAMLLMMGIGMLVKAVFLPEMKSVLQPVIESMAPRSPLGFVAFFTLLSPLVLYRGPLNPWGIGIGIYALLNSLSVWPPLALLSALMCITQIQGVCDPTNTHNVWVASYTDVPVGRITRMTLLFQMGVVLIGLLLGAAMYF